MRDLIKRGVAAASAPLPKGLAFEIADLAFVRRWADRHDFTIVVRLDHGVEDEEYEEAIAFHAGNSPYCRFIMWRNTDAVFIQPLLGRRQRYASAADALQSIKVKRRDLLDLFGLAVPLRTVDRQRPRPLPARNREDGRSIGSMQP